MINERCLWCRKEIKGKVYGGSPGWCNKECWTKFEEQEQPNEEKQTMTTETIWRSNETKHLFHDSCFEPNETREGFTALALSDVDLDDECASCGGIFRVDEAEDDEEEWAKQDDEADEDDDEDE